MTLSQQKSKQVYSQIISAIIVFLKGKKRREFIDLSYEEQVAKAKILMQRGQVKWRKN